MRCVKTARESVNAQKFLQFVQDDLVPILEPFNGINHNSVVVMDDTAIHHVQEVREAIEQAGARLIFFPPYSPDFNPIEGAVSKVKAYIRKNDIIFQACDMPENLIIEAFYQITGEDCYGYFKHAEYV